MTAKEASKFFSKHTIQLDIFNSEIVVFFNRLDFNKALAYRGEPELTGGAGATTHSILINKDTLDEDHILLIGIFNYNLSTIVHEASHASLFFANMIGHQITKADEIIPYLTSYITTSIIQLGKGLGYDC